MVAARLVGSGDGGASDDVADGCGSARGDVTLPVVERYVDAG
jgi:hypothetical protein